MAKLTSKWEIDFLVPSFFSESGLQLHVHPHVKDQPAPDYILSNCKYIISLL